MRAEHEPLDRLLGERLRLARAAKRRKRTVVAGLAGITTDYLYQIERGLKLPSVPVLLQLARVLGVPVASLLAEESARPPLHNSHIGDEVYRALIRPAATPAEHTAPTSGNLNARTTAAWHIWQTSPQRYSELSMLVPPLIADVERAVRTAVASNVSRERRTVYERAAELYFLLRTFTKRIGRVDLSLLTADRALHAAEAADDPLRLVAAQWNLAHVLLADGQAEGAADLAMGAVEWLRPRLADDLDHMALCGSLLLVGSVAAVRSGDAWTARARVDEAAKLAARTGERNVLWTAFGPVNVAMHAVDIEQEAGEATEGLHLAEQVDHHKAASIERRVAFLLEQACC